MAVGTIERTATFTRGVGSEGGWRRVSALGDVMGIRSFTQGPLDKGRVTFNVPAASGNYASERLTLGAVASGVQEFSFQEIMALAETLVAGAVVELWLPQISDGTLAASARTDANYFLSGTNFPTLVAQGAIRWPLTGWPGGQIRVRSGGISGQMAISASGF